MSFLIWIGIVVTCFVLGVYLFDKRNSEGLGSYLIIVSSFLFAITCILTPFSYMDHVSDLGVIRGQDYVTQVHKDRLDRLDERLDTFQFPKGSPLMNGDSPVAAIVAAISDAEGDIATAEEKKARALVSLEQRKAGPFSFIVTFVGEE